MSDVGLSKKILFCQVDSHSRKAWRGPVQSAVDHMNAFDCWYTDFQNRTSYWLLLKAVRT